MDAIFEVLPLPDRQPISFQAVNVFHSPCRQEMRKQRNVADGVYSLRCSCGLEIFFPAYGEAQRVITEAAIGQRFGTLPAGSFTSEHKGEIEVRVKTVGYPVVPAADV